MVSRRDHEHTYEPEDRTRLVHPQPASGTITHPISDGSGLDAGVGDVGRGNAGVSSIGADNTGAGGAGSGGPDEALATAWQRRARSVFDDSVDRVDARIRSKLTRARYAALDELRTYESRRRWLRLPVTGLTVAAVAAVAVLVWNEGNHGVVPGELPLEDMELVAEVDSLEMLRDVEFYAWVGQQR